MNRLVGTVQKRIGVLISIAGLLAVITNFINSVTVFDRGVMETIMRPTVWLLLLSVIPFIFSIFIENRAFKLIQVAVIFFTGSISVIDSFEGFFGPALYLVAWLLMRQYGFLDTHKYIKNISVLVVLVGLSQISAYINSREGMYAGITILIYALFLSLMLVIIWFDEIQKQEELKKEHKQLQMNYAGLQEKLDELESNKEPFDLRSMHITPAEERVIRVLTIYMASNREIAERLNIAESTVKLHLYNIYNKIGVDNRFAIIDLCKYNFQ